MKNAQESFDIFHKISRPFIGTLYREDLTEAQLHYLARKSIAAIAAKSALEIDCQAIPVLSKDDSLYRGDISHYDKFFDDSLDVFAAFIKALVAHDKNLDQSIMLSGRPDLIVFIVKEMIDEASVRCLR